MTDLGKFKEQINKLVDYICAINPDPEFEKIRIKINLGMQANPRDTCNLFSMHITEFADQILKNDEDFFLKKDYKEELGAERDAYEQIIFKLKDLWVKLNSDNKLRIFNFIKILLVLSCKVCKNEPLRTIINKYRDPSNLVTFD
jgi:hypothetical protein